MIRWSIIPFSELTLTEWHDLLALRVAVFVVEQNCPYQEVDGKDPLAFHVIGRNAANETIATARVLLPGISYKEWSIGRVAVDEKYRAQKLGYELMRHAMQFIDTQEKNASIRISAQLYLKKFYENIGFEFTGKAYDEDGIPHIEMLLISHLQ